MSSLWLFVPAALVVFLVVTLMKHLAANRIQQFIDRRRADSDVVSRGEFVDGSRHLAVAMALSEDSFFYENSDMQASLDRKWIQEVEYEDELSTGQSVHGGKVLRLRCSSQTFEFVLAGDAARQWQAVLPPHRMSEPRNVIAV